MKKFQKLTAFLAVVCLVAAMLPAGIFAALATGEQSTADKWDGTAVAFTKGTGTKADPYLIESAEHLAYLAQQVNDRKPYKDLQFKLTTDIDLDNRPWTPIGGVADKSTPQFEGDFDGANHTITGLFYDDTATYTSGSTGGLGLFGKISGSVIENLTVVGNVISNRGYVGGITGYAVGSDMINCHFYGSVQGAGLNYSGNVGGLAGTTSAGTCTFRNCSVVTGENEEIRCIYPPDGKTTSGDKTTYTGKFAPENTGGLIGSVGGGADVVIEDSFFNGYVSGGDGTGGLVGTVNSAAAHTTLVIARSYSLGTVNNGKNGSAPIGGLIGWVRDASIVNTTSLDVTMSDCYSAVNFTNTIYTSNDASGLLGGARSYSEKVDLDGDSVKETTVYDDDVSDMVVTIKNCHFAGTNAKYPIVRSVTNSNYGTSNKLILTWGEGCGNIFYRTGSYTSSTVYFPGALTAADCAYDTAAFADGTVADLLDGGRGVWMSGKDYPIYKRPLPALSALSVDGQPIVLAGGITAYAVADVADTVDAVKVEASTDAEDATVTVIGADEDGSVKLGLPGTATEVTVAVSDSEVTSTYTIKVYRKPTPWDGTSIEPFAGGTGTETDPYLIENAAQLYFMAKTATELDGVTVDGVHYPYNNYVNKVSAETFEGKKYIKIVADIDLNGKTWTPIGYASANGTSTKTNGIYTFTAGSAFKGVLNGDNHTISNLNVTVGGKGNSNYFGFFVMICNATVENLHFKSAIIDNGKTGSAYMAGITAKAYGNATFKNCSFDGTIKTSVEKGGGASNFVGVMVGMIQMGANQLVTIEDCWSTGLIQHYANNAFGGLVGATYSTNVKVAIKSSWSAMTVKQTRTADKVAGGLVGTLSTGAVLTVEDSFFIGSVNFPNPICPTTDGVTLTNVHYATNYYNGTDENAVAGGALTNAKAHDPAAFADGTVAKLLGDGWLTSTAGYPVKTDLAASVTNALTDVATSIRSKGDSQGIRFKFAMTNAAQTTALKEAGVLLAQLTDSEGNIKAALADENLVMHNLQKGDEGYYKYVTAKAYEKGSAGSAFVEYTGSKDWFAAALVNFNTPEKMTTKYIARAYAIFTDAIGNEFVVYSNAIGDKEYNVSVCDVAEFYYNNETYRNQLTESELAYVNQLVNGALWYMNADWNDDGVLKILTIGNSFSEDATNLSYKVAQAAGVQNVVIGNMYISGCALATHLKHAKSGEEKYTYWYTDDGKWTGTGNDEGEPKFALVPVVASDNWDFITFQQSSSSSGVASTYDDLDELMEIVKANCTNPNVKFAWHMTWAYANGYHIGEDGVYGTEDDGTGAAAFKKYNYDQMTMYNAIVDAVETKIVPKIDPDGQFFAIVPNGTAIQNARTSYLGDTLNRDGTHLTKDTGRFIAAVGLVETLIGIDWNKFNVDSLRSIYPNDETFFDLALECVQNAVENPFEITQSAYTAQ